MLLGGIRNTPSIWKYRIPEFESIEQNVSENRHGIYTTGDLGPATYPIGSVLEEVVLIYVLIVISTSFTSWTHSSTVRSSFSHANAGPSVQLITQKLTLYNSSSIRVTSHRLLADASPYWSCKPFKTATIPLQQNNAGQKSVIDRSETAADDQTWHLYVLNIDYPEIFAEPGVFLTVNALASVAAGGNYLDRMLELNWYNFQILDGDWIGLFNYDPSINEVDHKQNALAIITPLTSEGTSKTSIRFAREDLNETYNSIKQNSCLGYWISYFKGSSPNVASSVNCIRRFPTWMNDLKDVIGDTPLTALMIPGTHDAGAWKLYAGRPDDNVVIAYTINQEETIYNQLIHGIRYLDVRVAHYPATEEKYFINHGDFRIRPIISLFEDVKRFVAETNEIVLMDFHNFPVGFHNSTDHENLLQFVLLHMGDVLVKKSVVGLNPTPNAIWATTASVVLTYSEDSISTKYSYLFPNLRHAWGNTNKMDELETYLAGAHNQYGCSGQFWSSMAELTPVTNDIILRPNFGLRGFAQLVNIPVTQWYRREAWYSKSNIISTDFFLGNNIIEMSVAVNQKRASCPSH